jgi:hypothetical protein
MASLVERLLHQPTREEYATSPVAALRTAFDIQREAAAELTRLQAEHDADAERLEAAQHIIGQLQAELSQHRASLPTCEKHAPTAGARGRCVICAGEALQGALSQIDYALGEPNDMMCSAYDFDHDEKRVVARVEQVKAELDAARMKPLTEDQIATMRGLQGTGIHWRLYLETVRAVERAHGIDAAIKETKA